MSDRVRDDEFYVGYLPTPREQRRFIVMVVALLWLLALGVAAMVALAQRDPGGATWDTATPRSYVGVVRLDPYPMLLLEPGGASDQERAGRVFVVQPGKRGAQEALAPFDGARVRLEGYRLERQGRRVVELAPDARVVRLGDGPSAEPATSVLGEAVIDGEIVDYKCFLGAMKPGDGKGHKACATLCIRGGIPPMLVRPAPDGSLAYTLLVGPDGRADTGPILEYVGEPVRVTGTLVRRGDLTLLRFSAVQRR